MISLEKTIPKCTSIINLHEKLCSAAYILTGKEIFELKILTTINEDFTRTITLNLIDQINGLHSFGLFNARLCRDD